MIPLAQIQSSGVAPWVVPSISLAFGAVSTLMYWSLGRNVAAVDRSAEKTDGALAEAFDRIRTLETKVAVQETEIRHLQEKCDLAERIDAVPAKVRAAVG